MFKLVIHVRKQADNFENKTVIPVYSSKSYDNVLNKYVSKYNELLKVIESHLESEEDFAEIIIQGADSKKEYLKRKIKYSETSPNVYKDKQKDSLFKKVNKMTKVQIVNKIKDISNDLPKEEIAKLNYMKKDVLVNMLVQRVNNLDVNKIDNLKISNLNRTMYIMNIADYFGKEKQLEKVKEELRELIKAIKNDDLENIKEEIADVKIMLFQLCYLLKINDKEIEDIMNFKVKRTLKRFPDISKIKN